MKLLLSPLLLIGAIVTNGWLERHGDVPITPTIEQAAAATPLQAAAQAPVAPAGDCQVRERRV